MNDRLQIQSAPPCTFRFLMLDLAHSVRQIEAEAKECPTPVKLSVHEKAKIRVMHIMRQIRAATTAQIHERMDCSLSSTQFALTVLRREGSLKRDYGDKECLWRIA